MSPFTRTQRVLGWVTVALLGFVMVGLLLLRGNVGELDEDDKLVARSDEITYCVGIMSDVRADAQLRATADQLDATEDLLTALAAALAENPEDLAGAVAAAIDEVASGRSEVDYGLEVSALMTDTRETAQVLSPDPDDPAGKFACPDTPPAP